MSAADMADILNRLGWSGEAAERVLELARANEAKGCQVKLLHPAGPEIWLQYSKGRFLLTISAAHAEG